MYNTYGYNYNYGADMARTGANIAGGFIWLGIAAILALIGGILAYYLFVKPDKKQNSPFLERLREFLRFNSMFIEGLLKVFYIIGAIFTTLSAFAWVSLGGGLGIISFLSQITIGNVVLRIVYEAMLIKIMIWKNTTEINKKMK